MISPEKLPRIIWTYWEQGWDNAPELPRCCAQSWKTQNPDWEVRCLDKTSFVTYLTDEIHKLSFIWNLSTMKRSNVIRMHLLRKYSGVWVDATCFCCRPLSQWLFPYISPSGFFAFANPGPDRLLSTWFLACVKDNEIIGKWCNAYDNIMSTRLEKELPIFQFHYTFGSLYDTDKELKTMWDNTPKFSADLPHFLQVQDDEISAVVEEHVEKQLSPVYKLNWRTEERVTFQFLFNYYKNLQCL